MPIGDTIEIDLSRGIIEKREGDLALVRDYVASKGTGTRILWDRVPPEVDAFAPESTFIMSAGVLTGTLVPGANRLCIVYKSPATNIHCYSSVGGFLGTALKRTGYDTVIVSGKSDTPVYLYINDDRVELRDARHLWGHDTRQTESLIRKELGDQAEVLSIGLAGENKVLFATAEHGAGDCAGRGGFGALMGDKNLKAIAIHGTKDIPVADTERLFDICNYILSRTHGARKGILDPAGYTFVRTFLRWADFRNFGGIVQSPEFQEEIKNSGPLTQAFIERTREREVACANCSLRCKHAYRNTDGTYVYHKCAGFYYAMFTSQILKPEFSLACKTLFERYGLDIYSTGDSVAFAIDLYEKGILTREDTDGLHLEWQNPDVYLALVHKIARREGIGDVLANGTYRAARQIGKGAERYAFTAKKLELHMNKIYHRYHMALSSAVCDRGDMTKLDSGTAGQMPRRPLSEREAYIKDGWFHYPDSYKKYFLEEGADAYGNSSIEAQASYNSYDMEQYTLADLSGICMFWLEFWMWPTINSRAMMADLMTAVTGLEIDEAEATRIASRVISLVRAYSVREGLRRQDDFDSVPKHTFEREPRPPERKLEPDTLDQLLDKFYEIRGWDRQGIPTAANLEELDLGFVREDMERRGILEGKS
ncbi:MAG: hypothetical protein HY670_05610 [Chloroflexi bacterium]|nr:hypothetical protein [Chloroflexota bacterium]